MNVKISLVSNLASTVGKKEINIQLNQSHPTLINVFKAISKNYSKLKEVLFTDDFKLQSGIICIVNNQLVFEKDLKNLKINDSDTIAFSMAISGGLL